MLHRFTSGRVHLVFGDAIVSLMPIYIGQRATNSFGCGMSCCLIRCLAGRAYHDKHLLIGLKRMAEKILQRPTVRLGNSVYGK